MTLLNYITWDVDPVIFSIGQFSLRWYGTLFAGGFFIGYLITQRVWRMEKQDETKLDTLLILLVLGALVGARLGHVFFYQWDYYSQHLSEIPAVWKGGLASHGGALGLILVFWIFSRFVIKKHLLWVTDRVVMSVALTAGMIRTGNLMNSEILGSPTDLPWAFIFTMRDAIPRHPAQLYEALAYYSIAALLFYLFFKTPSKNNRGFITGVFLAMTFTARVLLEFLKENQVPFEETMTLNMGQWLSFPLIALGLYLIWGSGRKTA